MSGGAALRLGSLLLDKFEQIAGLAFQLAAKGFEGAEADGLGLVGFQNREIGEREVHARGEVGERDAAVGHDLVKVESDRHGSDREVVFLLECDTLPKHLGEDRDEEAGENAADPLEDRFSAG